MPQNFFKWLVPNLDRLFEDKELQAEVSTQVQIIHPDLNWEVGPGINKECFFAFSPSLNKELLAYTKELCESAPQLEGWEFFAAKPKKEWKERCIQLTPNGETVEYFFDEWRYYLTSFNNGEFFDVNLIPDDKEYTDKESLEYAADLFVEFELGELMYMELIDRVNIIDPEKDNNETTEVKYLYDQLLEQRA
jgi:hypothetical protein